MLLVDCLWHNTNIVIDIHGAIDTAMLYGYKILVVCDYKHSYGRQNWAYMRPKLFTSSIYVNGEFVVSIIES